MDGPRPRVRLGGGRGRRGGGEQQGEQEAHRHQIAGRHAVVNPYILCAMRALLLAGLLAAPAAAGTGTVPFSEFEKVLAPGPLWPLDSGDASLTIVRLPKDKYPKLYRLDHESQEFSPVFDAGGPIRGLWRDDLGESWYFLEDEGGDENYRILKLNEGFRGATEVYGHKDRRASIVDASQDGKRLYVLSNHEDKAVFRLYRFEPATGKEEALSPPGLSVDAAVLDSYEKRAALTSALGNNETRVTLLDLKTKEATPLLAKADTVYEAAFFHPERAELWVTSDDGRDRVGCASVSLSSPTLVWTRAEDGKDVWCAYDRRADLSTLTSAYDGRRTLRVFEGAFDREVPLPLPEKAFVSNLAWVRGTTRAVARVSAYDNPGDYFEFDLWEGADQPLLKVTKLNVSSIDPALFGKSEDLRFKSFDGLDIHGIVYAPEAWKKDGAKRPAIVWPHGGPDFAESHDWRAIFQFWNLNGFVVFAPNFRGSLGYGKKFETLNDRDWGGGHIEDVVWGKRELAKLPYVDPERVFIAGGSFGGYSTLSAVTKHPAEFRAAAAFVALANLFTFLKSIPPDPAWQNEFAREVGDPVKDEALLKERSPFFHADQVKVPLKVWQAENDVRTVKAEMDAFTGKLRELGIPVEYVVLPDEGHSFQRKESLEQVLQGTVDFFRKNL
ncbi:S9 family peptidase [bacterium]|nr:MAG: S9 family peptidase [bacterium]